MLVIDDTFKKSLARVSNQEIGGLDFLEYFYQIFKDASPHIAELFANTSIKAQKELLKKSLTELLRFYSEKKVNQHLLAIGQLHSEGALNISPSLYDLWLKTLMSAVKKYDPEFYPKVELAWRVTLSPGIAYMKFAYDHPNLL